MSYTIKFLLGLQIEISFIKDIVKKFRPIIKIRHMFTYLSDVHKFWGKSQIMIYFSTRILYQFYLKYLKTVLIFHLHRAVFACNIITLFRWLHVTGRVSKPLIYKQSFTIPKALNLHNIKYRLLISMNSGHLAKTAAYM